MVSVYTFTLLREDANERGPQWLSHLGPIVPGATVGSRRGFGCEVSLFDVSATHVLDSRSSYKEGNRHDPSLGRLDPPPPPPPGPTYYRLLGVTTVAVWAISKAVLSFKNGSIEPTTLDLLAALFGVA